MSETRKYDAVIVGAGLAGAIIANQLGKAGYKVLIIESGSSVPASREDYMQRFYLQLAKTPESPYPPNPNAPRPTVLQLGSDGAWKDPSLTYLDQSSPQTKLPFSSTYERRGGGTMWHWLGSSFRFVPNDFKLKSCYGQGADWPISYPDLSEPRNGRSRGYYGEAEWEIGVAADVKDQGYLGIQFPAGYEYPNPSIPLTLTDQFFGGIVNGKMQFDGQPVTVYPTPAGRNSRPFGGRRQCAGNTNCIPICPIQAKYDPTITLNNALNTGNVDIIYQAVASKVKLDAQHREVAGIEYIRYDNLDKRSPSATGTAVGRFYIIAAHAIETPKLLLNSNEQLPGGVANGSKQVGRNLMDHPLYLRWGLTQDPTFPYRGPLATAGIESLRDGAFRKNRAAFRVEFGNEGWNFAAGDPETTTLDLVEGTNNSGTNPELTRYSGRALVTQLNSIFTRQFRFGYLMEQSAEDRNTVTLSNLADELGIPRPKITYDLSDYTKRGFVAAKKLTDEIFAKAGVKPFTKDVCKMKHDAGFFTYDDPKTGEHYDFEFFGAGHVVGTCRMGFTNYDSVVNAQQRSWDHPNLFITGSSIFPTIATGNPSLTIAALAFWAADNISAALKERNAGS